MPTVVEEGVRYYPITYLSEKVLKRSKLITNTNLTQYKKYIKEFNIKYGEKNIQKTKCISEEGLKNSLLLIRVGWHTISKRRKLNVLLEYLGLETVTEREFLIRELLESELNKHNEYVKDIIKDFINNYKNKIKYQLCIKCDKYYPLHKKFFNYFKESNSYDKTCNECRGEKISTKNNINSKGKIIGDKVAGLMYRKYGEEGYKEFKENGVVRVYFDYIRRGEKLPNEIYDRENYLEIIKYLFDNEFISKDNISLRLLKEDFGLRKIDDFLKLKDIYGFLFGDDFYLYPWKYKSFDYKGIELTYELACKIFDNYLVENNIIIKDIFNFKYTLHIEKCRLTKYRDNILEFIVKCNKELYPGYMFKTPSSNYYKNKERRIFDLKYLIEKDLQIPIEKIPLYLTIGTIRKKSSSLYLVLKKYYNNLFEWVDEIYPDKFIEADFIINPYRNEFQSNDELIIDDVLRNNFNNVIYNRKNSAIEIKINEMTPDWFVFLDTNVWIVEYFGNYSNRKYNNKRIEEYRKRTKNKIKKYKGMSGYKHVFLFPKDLENDMKILYKKLELVKDR